MKAKATAARFGELYEISKGDWVREVTEASRDVSVVALLYEDGILECRVMEVSDRHREWGGIWINETFSLFWEVFKRKI